MEDSPTSKSAKDPDAATEKVERTLAVKRNELVTTMAPEAVEQGKDINDATDKQRAGAEKGTDAPSVDQDGQKKQAPTDQEGNEETNEEHPSQLTASTSGDNALEGKDGKAVVISAAPESSYDTLAVPSRRPSDKGNSSSSSRPTNLIVPTSVPSARKSVPSKSVPAANIAKRIFASKSVPGTLVPSSAAHAGITSRSESTRDEVVRKKRIAAKSVPGRASISRPVMQYYGDFGDEDDDDDFDKVGQNEEEDDEIVLYSDPILSKKRESKAPKEGSSKNALKSLKTKKVAKSKAGTETAAKKGPKTPVAKAATKIKGGSRARLSACEIWCGPPDEPLEGGWPDGWLKRIFQRASGATKGSTDRYWYSPKKNKKFRSMVEIKRFMAALEEYGGDEDAAWKHLKQNM